MKIEDRLSRHRILRLWLIQIGVAVLLALFCALEFNLEVAGSVLLGSVTYLLPNMCFAYQLFKHRGAQFAKKILTGFYKGEALKIVFSAFLFAVVFALFKGSPLAFFASYILMLVLHWITPWIVNIT